MHTLIVQHEIVWERKVENHDCVDRLLDQAAPPAGSLIALAELFDTGFSMDLSRIVDDRTLAWACSAASRRQLRLVVGHAEVGDDGRGRNCATIVDGFGCGIGTYRKVHPFSHGKESEYYTGGNRLVVAEIDGVGIAPLICYDLRFPELWRLAALAGAEVFVIGANWPARRQAHWRALCIARAIENQAFVVAVNRIGSDPRIEYAGGSLIVDPRGKILAEAGSSACTLEADLDLKDLRAWRTEFPVLADVRAALLGSIPVDRATDSVVDDGESAPTR